MQPVQMIDLTITGNSNNPISNLAENTLLAVEWFDWISAPTIIGGGGGTMVFGLGTIDPYNT